MCHKSRDDVHGGEVVVVHVVEGAVLVGCHVGDVGDVLEGGVEDPVEVEGEVEGAVDRDGAEEVVNQEGLLDGEGDAVLLLEIHVSSGM